MKYKNNHPKRACTLLLGWESTLLLLLIVTLAAAATAAAAVQNAQQTKGARREWKTFVGSHFVIQYPPNFHVQERLTTPSGKGYDGALFEASNERVHFFVYSPRASDEFIEPAYLSRRADENLIGRATKTNGWETRRWIKLRSSDNRTTRIFYDIIGIPYAELGNARFRTRKVFGFEFRDNSAFEQYGNMFTRFQKSHNKSQGSEPDPPTAP